MEHKGIALVVLTIIGIVVAVVGFAVGAAIAVTAGVGILLGILISGLFSWISGNDLFGDEMLTDMLFGGVIGGISALFGWAAGTGAIASNVGRWLGTRIPWLGRAFPKMFGGAVGGGVDQSLWDIIKNGKINWKNTAIAALFAFTVSFGGGYASIYSDDIIKWINNREIPSFSQSLVMSGDSAALTAPTKTRIGDTRFGQWLQKFASNTDGGKSKVTSGIAAQKDSSKRVVDEFGNAIPYGFSSLDEYYKFVESLKSELPEDTVILFQGSSVTGKSHKTGKAFDHGRKSDFDIALVNDDLYLKGLDANYRTKTEPNRMGPLSKEELEELGLLEVQNKMSQVAGRPVSFMLFESVEDALRRPSIMVVR